MERWVCTTCGYVYKGENAPEKCPQCGVPASKSKKQASGGMVWVYEHEAGMAQGAPGNIMMDLRANFEGECSEVGIYLAMSRVAHREGYPEIDMYWTKAASGEAERAAKFTELLGRIVASSTEKNLEMKAAAKNGVIAGKFDLARRAKALDLDVIHGTVHKMVKDEARHGKTFESLLSRYSG